MLLTLPFDVILGPTWITLQHCGKHVHPCDACTICFLHKTSLFNIAASMCIPVMHAQHFFSYQLLMYIGSAYINATSKLQRLCHDYVMTTVAKTKHTQQERRCEDCQYKLQVARSASSFQRRTSKTHRAMFLTDCLLALKDVLSSSLLLPNVATRAYEICGCQTYSSSSPPAVTC